MQMLDMIRRQARTQARRGRDLIRAKYQSPRYTSIGPRLGEYIVETWANEPAAAAGLREATLADPAHDMQVGPDHGRILHWLASTIGATRAIEVGVFTGYSALWTAMALPDDGTLVACDVSTEWTDMGKPFWAQAGVDHKIDLRIAPAAETLQNLLDQGEAGSFDMAFIDADKENYDTYYELCLELVRPNGIIAIDNVLWGGAVANPKKDSIYLEAIRTLNAKVGKDPRVEACLVPVGDGLTLTRRL